MVFKKTDQKIVAFWLNQRFLENHGFDVSLLILITSFVFLVNIFASRITEFNILEMVLVKLGFITVTIEKVSCKNSWLFLLPFLIKFGHLHLSIPHNDKNQQPYTETTVFTLHLATARC